MPRGCIYQFGRFRFESAGRLLFRDGQPVPLAPKPADTLLLLLENAGEVISKEQLLKQVWKDAFIEEGSLTRTISVLRKALDDSSEECIATISKRGYRFVARPAEISRDNSPGRADKVMVAVLPFENFSADQTQAYFCDGLTEEMIAALGRLNPQRLGVIARTSAMTYKSSGKTIRQIGVELGVAYILEGSIRRSGRRVRIVAQLIQTSDQTHLWAENYERELDDILVLQSEVAQAIAQQIHVKLVPAEQERLRKVQSMDPRAYEAYLQGRYLWNKRTRKDLQSSLQQFKRAVRYDPRCAAAYAGMADSYLTLQDESYFPSVAAIKQAKIAAEKALEIDATLAEAHNSLAHAYFHELNWEAAEREFKRGIALNPSCVTVHFYYANLLIATGRSDHAIVEARCAQALDPRSLAAEDNLARILYYVGRLDESIACSLRVLEDDPNYGHACETLGWAYEEQGRYKDATAAFKKAVACSGRAPRYLAGMARACALSGQRDEALRLLRELKALSTKKFVPSYHFASVFVGLGDRDRAIAWLAKDCRQKSSHVPFLRTSPRFAPLRADRRFQELLRAFQPE